MPETTIAQLPDPSGFSADPFTDIIRDGARKLIEQAIHTEWATLMAAFSAEKLENGTSRLVRHGHLPEREVMTGIGPVSAKVPRVRERKPGEDKITFTPSILPRTPAQGEIGRGSAALALPQGGQHGGLQRGARGTAGPKRPGAFRQDDHAA